MNLLEGSIYCNHSINLIKSGGITEINGVCAVMMAYGCVYGACVCDAWLVNTISQVRNEGYFS